MIKIDEQMEYIKITMSANDLLSLKKKREYIDSLHAERATHQKDIIRNQGFVHKFNNAIGFKPLVYCFNNCDSSLPLEVESPEEYISPKELLFQSMRTPIVSFSIVEFYIPVMEVLHPNPSYSYNTLLVADKWSEFLKKVFPHLVITNEIVSCIPKQSIRDFAFEYFYSSIEKELICTIEFSSAEKLTDEDIAYMLPKLQLLTDDKITIAQFSCKTCSEHSNGAKPYHIEIVYLSWYGKDRTEQMYQEYGDAIYQVE